jgi:hypothetical protein
MGWPRLVLLIVGWLAGLFFGLSVVTSRPPEYELVTADAPHTLGPMSFLQIALTPHGDSRTLPGLCGFTSDGTTLQSWAVPYSHAYRGTILIKGEIRDLLPVPAAKLETIKELVFVVTSPLSPCHPAVIAGLQSLDGLAKPWLGRTISSLLGVRTLRLPVQLRAESI